MQKIIKRSFFLFIALTILLVKGPSIDVAYASEGTGGSITIKESMKEKEYRGYRIFDLTYSEDSSDKKNVSYTISAEWEDFFETEAGSKYIVSENIDDKLNSININGEIKFINITEEKVEDFARDAFSYAAKKDPTFSINGTGDDLKVSVTELGYYLVYPVGAVDIKDNYGSIVSLTSTTPNAEINIKSEYPTIEKTADKTTADLGDPIKFTVKGKVPETTGYDKYDYIITDTLSNGLTLDKESINIYIGQDKIESPEDKGIIINTEEGQKLIIKFDMSDFQEQVGKDIEITYMASLNENAVIGEAGNTNSVILEYSNDPKDTDQKEKTPPTTVKVYNAKIQISKVDGKDESKALQGAKFILKNEADKYYQIDESNSKITWVDNIEEATEVETNEDGLTEFKGLSAGKYKLEETKAPNGYNKLTEDLEIEVKEEDASKTGVVVAKVKNNSGIELPGTGGSGTTIFKLVGSGLVLLAGYSLLKNKSKKKENQN